MNRFYPQPRILAVWRVHLVMIMTVPAFLNAVFYFGKRVWFWSSAIWLAFFLLLYLVYLPLRVRRLAYALNKERLFVESGVFIRRTKALPLCNIQYTTLYRGPLGHLFGVCSLTVTAAGGRALLPGLRPEDAEALAKILSEPPDKTIDR